MLKNTLKILILLRLLIFISASDLETDVHSSEKTSVVQGEPVQPDPSAPELLGDPGAQAPEKNAVKATKAVEAPQMFRGHNMTIDEDTTTTTSEQHQIINFDNFDLGLKQILKLLEPEIILDFGEIKPYMIVQITLFTQTHFDKIDGIITSQNKTELKEIVIPLFAKYSDSLKILIRQIRFSINSINKYIEITGGYNDEFLSLVHGEVSKKLLTNDDANNYLSYQRLVFRACKEIYQSSSDNLNNLLIIAMDLDDRIANGDYHYSLLQLDNILDNLGVYFFNINGEKVILPSKEEVDASVANRYKFNKILDSFKAMIQIEVYLKSLVKTYDDNSEDLSKNVFEQNVDMKIYLKLIKRTIKLMEIYNDFIKTNSNDNDKNVPLCDKDFTFGINPNFYVIPDNSLQAKRVNFYPFVYFLKFVSSNQNKLASNAEYNSFAENKNYSSNPLNKTFSQLLHHLIDQIQYNLIYLIDSMNSIAVQQLDIFTRLKEVCTEPDDYIKGIISKFGQLFFQISNSWNVISTETIQTIVEIRNSALETSDWADTSDFFMDQSRLYEFLKRSKIENLVSADDQFWYSEADVASVINSKLLKLARLYKINDIINRCLEKATEITDFISQYNEIKNATDIEEYQIIIGLKENISQIMKNIEDDNDIIASMVTNKDNDYNDGDNTHLITKSTLESDDFTFGIKPEFKIDFDGQTGFEVLNYYPVVKFLFFYIENKPKLDEFIMLSKAGQYENLENSFYKKYDILLKHLMEQIEYNQNVVIYYRDKISEIVSANRNLINEISKLGIEGDRLNYLNAFLEERDKVINMWDTISNNSIASLQSAYSFAKILSEGIGKVPISNTMSDIWTFIYDSAMAEFVVSLDPNLNATINHLLFTEKYANTITSKKHRIRDILTAYVNINDFEFNTLTFLEMYSNEALSTDDISKLENVITSFSANYHIALNLLKPINDEFSTKMGNLLRSQDNNFTKDLDQVFREYMQAIESRRTLITIENYKKDEDSIKFRQLLENISTTLKIPAVITTQSDEKDSKLIKNYIQNSILKVKEKFGFITASIADSIKSSDLGKKIWLQGSDNSSGAAKNIYFLHILILLQIGILLLM